MKIKKSRIIEIIKEELKKKSEKEYKAELARRGVPEDEWDYDWKVYSGYYREAPRPEEEEYDSDMWSLDENSGDDSGLAPVSLTRTAPVTAPSDELATIEMQIHFLEEKLAELQARRADLAGEEPEQPEDEGPVETPEETEFAPVPSWVEKRYKDRMGED